MKLIGIGAFALLALVALAGLARNPQAAYAQVELGKGWIEGVIVTDKGEPATINRVGFPAKITVRPKDGSGIQTENDPRKGGFYTFRNIKPGVYEVFLDVCQARVREEDVSYKPIHIFGLVVEADKRTELNITVHEGTGLETFGKPTVPTQKAIIISEELEKLQRQIDELKKR